MAARAARTVTADGRALLAAVLADPDADLPRLVFADWLDDHGDPDRTELIRVACRLAALRCVQGCPCVAGDALPGCGGCGPCKEAWRLLGRHDERQVAAGWRLPAPMRTRAEFDRGLVVALACPAAAWAIHGDDFLACEPVRRVTLTALNVSSDFHWATDADWTRAHRAVGVMPSDYFGGGQESADAVHVALLTRRWPGIEFELPVDGLPLPGRRRLLLPGGPG